MIDIAWEFHEKQLKAFKSKARYVMACWGRRSGKGKLGSRKVWQKATENPGMMILVTGATYPQIRDVLVPNLNMEMPPGFARYKSSDKIYDCDNGCSILLRSIDNPEPLRGLGELVVYYWGDEFALYPAMVWDEILSYTIVDNEAPALFTSTPKGAGKFKELYDKGITGVVGYESFHCTSYENPFLPEGALTDLEDLPINIYNQEVLAQFIDDFGGVFRGVDDIVAGDWEGPGVSQYVAGIDLAKHSDFTVIKILDTATNHVVYSNRFNQLDWTTQVSIIENDLRKYNNALCWVDSTGIGDPIYDDLVKRGLRIQGYKFTNESKRALIEHLVISVQNKSFTHPDDPNWINEMKMYQAEQLPSGRIRYNAPSGYHDDECIATGLMCWGGIKKRATNYNNFNPEGHGTRPFT